MGFKEDLLWTVQCYAYLGPWRPKLLTRKSSVSMEIGMHDLFYNYVKDRTLVTGFVPAGVFNPLMHMLNAYPFVSCFYEKGSRLGKLPIVKDKRFQYILNNELVQAGDTYQLRYMYPDSVMLARASGKLPGLLQRYASDIKQIINERNQHSPINCRIPDVESPVKADADPALLQPSGANSESDSEDVSAV